MPVRSSVTVLGGTAANIARVGREEGLATALVCRVGEDFPPPFWRALHDRGIDMRGVERVAGARSPTCYILEDGAQGQMTLIDQGAMGHAAAAPLPQGLLRRCRWVHLTTGDPTFQLRMARAARARAIPVAADPAQEIHYRWKAPQLARLLSMAEILFGNSHELARAAQLLGVSGPPELVDRVPLVVMTRGARGAVSWSRRGRMAIPAAGRLDPRRVTGAGDAFRGGFYGGWLRGVELRGCLQAGVRAASRWLRRPLLDSIALDRAGDG